MTTIKQEAKTSRQTQIEDKITYIVDTVHSWMVYLVMVPK